MANFNIGDRVKVVNFDKRYPSCVAHNGCTGTVISLISGGDGSLMFEVWVKVDGADEVPFFSYELTPIRPLPSAYELMTRENAPDFDIRIPEVAHG